MLYFIYYKLYVCLKGHDMKTKKIRVGVIGCGGISSVHINSILNSSDMELGALCDIIPAKMDEKKKLHNIKDVLCYINYIEMLDSGKVDAVSICTPNNVHFEIAMEAIKRKIPYAIEKPICNCIKEAKTLLNTTKKKNVPNMVCFSYRFVAAARYVRDMIVNGDIGNIYHINCNYYQSWGLPKFNIPRVWRYNKAIAGSGAIGDLGSHMFDLLRFITNKEFIKIRADYDTFTHQRPDIDNPKLMEIVDVDDYVNVIGQMEGPIAVNISISRFTYSRGNYQMIEIYGDKGAIRYNLEDNHSGTVEINMGNEPMEKGHIWIEAPIPQKYNSSQMQSFADIINGCGDGLAATIEDGYVTQEIIKNVLDSN